jgi:hypothetical protein
MFRSLYSRQKKFRKYISKFFFTHISKKLFKDKNRNSEGERRCGGDMKNPLKPNLEQVHEQYHVN